MRTRARLSLALALALVLAAPPIGAQISSRQVRERYRRHTRGTTIEDFVRQLGSDDPETRLQGVKSLAESGDERAVEYLLQALGDPDMRVKAKAIDALGNLRAREATPVLIQHLFLRATKPSVKKRILASLGKIGDPRAAKPILEYLHRDLDADTKGTAIFALGEIGAPEALGYLHEVARTDPDGRLRRLAAQAAAKVEYHQAVLKVEAKEPPETFLRPHQPRRRR